MSPVKRRNRLRPDGCVTPNEAGRLLGITGEAVKNYIRKGRIRAAKSPINGYWWIQQTDLDNFRQEQIGALVFKYHSPQKNLEPQKSFLKENSVAPRVPTETRIRPLLSNVS